MKKRTFIIYSILLILFGYFVSYFHTPKNNEYTLKDNNQKKSNFSNRLSMMLETGANTDTYELTTRDSWPTSGYKFNSKLSKCENGGSVSWDFANKNVVMEGSSSDKCYIYFDKIVTVNEYCNAGTNLADCIKTYGNAGYDTSSIYIHDSSLKNGAGDNSYRFAGASDYVNNYVCFGSDADVCPNDNLYRIIGVFGDQVKLIKYDYATSELLGTDGDYNTSETTITEIYYKGLLSTTYYYRWNYNANKISTNDWSSSLLNTVNLNTNYLNNIGNTWANMIVESSWKVGGNTYANIETSPIYEIYQNEIVNPAQDILVNSKVGLMYASDYGYAASSKYWTCVGHDKNNIEFNDMRISRNENWIFMGRTEWIITPYSETTNMAYRIDYFGNIHRDNGYTSNSFSIRPTFYLKNSINYNGGSGTKDSPIRVGVALSEYIKSQYTLQGENDLYLHNGTIKSGDTVIDANDGSYRYSGANPNNYVCFGTDASTCPSNNLYRIIGVFEDNVKLIKAELANSDVLGIDGAYFEENLSDTYFYYWYNSSNINNVWNTSLLNVVNLNKNFITYLNNQNPKWIDMISETIWQVGGNTDVDIVESPMYTTYQKEIVSPVEREIESAKVGLMYVSDYGYAASPTYWTYSGYNSSDSSKDYSHATTSNWLYLGIDEWTITRRSNYQNGAFYVYNDGTVHGVVINGYNAVRPCFYLNENVLYSGGIGSASDPIKLIN